jgi:hypothetical protein
MDLEATLLVPVAVAAGTGLPLAATSTEVAQLAQPYVASVILL